jgi:hypothetical protein
MNCRYLPSSIQFASLVYSLCFYLNVPPRKAIEIRTITMGSKPLWRNIFNVKSEMSCPYSLRYFHFFSQYQKWFCLETTYLVSLFHCCFIMRFHKEFCPILISFGLSRSSATILIIVLLDCMRTLHACMFATGKWVIFISIFHHI